MIELTTPRCRLTPAHKADIPFIAALYADPVVRRYLGGASPPHQEDRSADRIVADRTRTLFAARLKSNGNFVGVIAISPHHEGPFNELSYMFSPAYWHQGLAMECATAVLDLAFDEMGHEEIIAETQKGNAASRRLLERLGMTPWKSLRRFGERQELYILRIADWRARTNVNT